MPMNYRPTAHALDNGRIAVYCGAQYNHLPRHEAIDLFRQLGEALDMAVPPNLEFQAWADQLHTLPDHQVVIERFGVSRARAYRLIATERARRQACSSAR